MQPAFKVEFVSWGKITSLARTLATRIHNSGYQPDIVVAIARGVMSPQGCYVIIWTSIT